MNTAAKRNGKALLADLLFDLAGCFLLAFAVQCFSAPNNIAPGGITGVSILINYLYDLPISLVSFGLNIPLLLMAWVLLGKGFTLRTLKTLAIFTSMLELCALFPAYTGNVMLAALYDGVLEGVGLALVLMRGSTTGGTDVASRLIQIKFPYMPVGRLMLLVDGCVLLSAAIVYRNVENALYALIAIFTCSRVVDSILYGLDMGKVMMVVTRKPQEIAGAIDLTLGRGSTVLSGKGGYKGEDRPVLMCAVRKNQLYELKKLVHQIDPAAFLMAIEANEIIGEGFKDPWQEKRT